MFTLLTVESYIRDTDKPLHVYIQPKTIMFTKLFVYKTPGNNNEYIIYKSYLLLYFLVLIINWFHHDTKIIVYQQFSSRVIDEHDSEYINL